MLQNHAQELALLIAQSKEIEDKIAVIKTNMLAEMKADNLTTYKSDFGTVSFVTRKKYVYSDAVKKKEEEVKILKVEEEEKGIAQVSVTEFVQMNLPKVKTI